MAEERFVKYGDRTMPIEPGISLEQVKELMARHFPELAEPKVEKKDDHGKTVYVFSKKAGIKGARDARASAAAVKSLVDDVETDEMMEEIGKHIQRLMRDESPGEITDLDGIAEDMNREAEHVGELRAALAQLPVDITPTGSVL
jgi:PRTRC genetic system protein C